MNNTQEHTSIRWETIDGQPVAHLAISMDADFEELRELGRAIYSTLAEMEWAQAQLLEVGARAQGLRNMHIVGKAEYEQNHSAAALCGRSAEWDIVHILQTSVKGGICKKCLAMKESEGGAHGSK